jgi:hypothetical protein
MTAPRASLEHPLGEALYPRRISPLHRVRFLGKEGFAGGFQKELRLFVAHLEAKCKLKRLVTGRFAGSVENLAPICAANLGLEDNPLRNFASLSAMLVDICIERGRIHLSAVLFYELLDVACPEKPTQECAGAYIRVSHNSCLSLALYTAAMTICSHMGLFWSFSVHWR